MSSTTADVRNEYLEQVAKQGRQLEEDLRPRRAMKMIASSAAPKPCADAPAGAGLAGACEEVAFDLIRRPEPSPAGNAVDVRVTGFWRWKSVVVPPHAYVVHTRRGRTEPLHCGLGISFRFDPVTDSFLVVPAAMQTLLLNANCICRERQGILVQGYVQWIIDDFATAYRRLDFSDALDPMRVVNVQLREQAEAAIKDVVATMSIDDVLADKQPIIKELTARLGHVAEGDAGDRGLGLRIVTVQIKEAVVSSPRVWEMLQRPFRAERSKDARLAELANEALVRTREAEEQKSAEAERIATEAEVARLNAEAEARAFDRDREERVRRAKAESETLAQTAAHEREKIERDAELLRLRIEHELVEQGMRLEAQNRQKAKELEFEAARRRVDNELSAGAVQLKLIEALPGIAAQLPKPDELKTLSIGGPDGLATLVGGLLRLVESLRAPKA
jgi:regulator of protease activity HflC (stomatin/prohibitin superfamily)